MAIKTLAKYPKFLKFQKFQTAVKSKILVVEQKDSGFINNSPGHTCHPVNSIW